MTGNDLFVRAQKFFEKGRLFDKIGNIDQTIQFSFKDYDSFYVEIKTGELTVKKGVATPDFWNVLNIQTDKKTMIDIINGKLTLAEAMLEERLKVKEMAKKPVTSWFGQMIRTIQEGKFRYPDI